MYYRAMIFAALLLAGCSCNGGFRNMSDSWCYNHPNARGAGGYNSPDECEKQSGEPCVLIEQPTRTPEQSWDQANLKRHDSGCPKSIYIAPDGNLEQC